MSHRTLFAPTVLISVTAFGCAVDAPLDEELSSEAILGGELTMEHPSVVTMTFAGTPDTASRCTGALLSPRVLVTAKHCVDRPPSLGYLHIQPHDVVDSVLVRIWETVPVGDLDAVLVILGKSLQDDMTRWGAVPLPLASAPPMPGDALRLIGFGRTATDEPGDGKKRAVDSSVEEVRDDIFTTPYWTTGNTCHGDSGGPAIRNGEILGILSRGGEGPWPHVWRCGNQSWYVRADRIAAVAAQAMARAEVLGQTPGYLPPDPCRSRTACGACVADGRCGMCATPSGATCMAGDWISAFDAACDGDWSYGANACGAG